MPASSCTYYPCVVLLVFLGVVASLSSETESEWQEECLAKVGVWERKHGVHPGVAAAAKARLAFRKYVSGKMKKLRSRVDESVGNFVEDLLSRHCALLMKLDAGVISGKVTGERGLDLMRSLRNAEGTAYQYIQAAEDLIRAQMMEPAAVDKFFGRKRRTFDALYGALETLHGGGRVPQESFGLSAKFVETGAVSRHRYHICVQFARVWQALPKKDVISCARRVANVLNAPEIVHRWIDHLEQEKDDCPTLGFGVDEDDDAAKIYVATRAHEDRIPDLPVKGSMIDGLHNFIPATSERVGQIVSLEWKMSESKNNARLRHYVSFSGVSYESLSDQLVGAVHPRSVSHKDSGGAVREHKQNLLDFLSTIKAEAELVSSADIENGVLSSDRTLPSKLGLLGHAPDEKFADAAQRLVKDTVLEQHVPNMRSWIDETAEISPHLLSNVQMGQDRRNQSYISIYRHPGLPIVVSLAALQRHAVLQEQESSAAPAQNDARCQEAYDNLRSKILTCNPRQVQDECPKACAELIQRTLQACRGCKQIRRRQALREDCCCMQNRD